jgi:hypothetical protein
VPTLAPGRLFEARCDWLEANLSDVDPRPIIGELAQLLGARPAQAHPLRGYQQHVQLIDTTEAVQSVRCAVLWQHPESPDRVRVSGNGPAGEVVRKYLSAAELPWSVARYDSAVDMLMDDTQFARRHGRLFRLCQKIDKPTRPIGCVQRGRTLELNAFVKTAVSSPHKGLPEAQVMFYEKGKQLGTHPEWKRVELRLRPGKPEAKAAASSFEPSAAWGAFGWTREVLRIATNGLVVAEASEYPRFRVALPEVEERLKRIRAMGAVQQMAKQYRRNVETLVEALGEDEAKELIWSLLRGERQPQDTPAQAYSALWCDLPDQGKLH